MKSFRNNQLYRLCVARFLETVREPEVLFWGIVFPVLISIGLGLAFTQNSESKFNIVIVGENRGALDSLLQIYAQPKQDTDKEIFVWKTGDEILGNTEFKFVRDDWSSAIITLKRGEADLVVSDSSGSINYHFDPYNSQAQLTWMKLSALIRQATDPQFSNQSETALKTEINPLTLKGVRYIDFLVPGLIVFGLMGSILWGFSYTIIEWRSKKLLRRMVATPMRKSNFLIALMLVRTAMNLIEAVIIFVAVWLLFDISIQGNIGALFVLFLAGNLAFSGVAVLISCNTSKTEVGSGLINAVQMPMMILSGIFFSYHNFPEWSIGFIKLLPLTALADGFRAIFNEGAGWMETLVPTAALTLFGLICFAIGLKRFRWF